MPSGQTRLLFMGTPLYVVPVLEALTSVPNIHLVCVYTPPDRPRGRGRPIKMPPVRSFAEERGVPVRQPESLRSAGIQAELAELRPDIILVAAYGKLLPSPVLRIPQLGCLNLHPSLLPRCRGPSPVATAILDGESVSGVTLMLLDEGMDTGPIVAQKEFPLNGRETAGSLTADLFHLGAGLLLESLGPWIDGRLTAQAQDEARATTTRKLQREDGQVDWMLPAAVLERRSRAYHPWPGLFTEWDGKALKLLDVVPLLPSGNQVDNQWGGPKAVDQPKAKIPTVPGQVVSCRSRETPVGVVTGDGLLGLRSLQLADRRAQSAEEFLRGHPAFIGSHL